MSINGSVFEGLTFFLARRVPMRDHFKSLIETNGGQVVRLEAQANFLIEDKPSVRPGQPGFLTYEFIESAIKHKQLPDPNKYQSCPPTTSSVAPSVAGSAKSTRTPFTEADDVELWEFMDKIRKSGLAVRGNQPYQELAARNPRHTYQSWRDRYIKKLIDQPHPLHDKKASLRAAPGSVPAAPAIVLPVASIPTGPPAPPPAPTPEDRGNELKERVKERQLKQQFVEAVEIPARLNSFERDDVWTLFDEGEDILNLPEKDIEEAWTIFAMHKSDLDPPFPSPQDWRDLWESSVKGAFVQYESDRQRRERATATPSSRREQHTPAAANRRVGIPDETDNAGRNGERDDSASQVTHAKRARDSEKTARQSPVKKRKIDQVPTSIQEESPINPLPSRKSVVNTPSKAHSNSSIHSEVGQFTPARNKIPSLAVVSERSPSPSSRPPSSLYITQSPRKGSPGGSRRPLGDKPPPAVKDMAAPAVAPPASSDFAAKLRHSAGETQPSTFSWSQTPSPRPVGKIHNRSVASMAAEILDSLPKSSLSTSASASLPYGTSSAEERSKPLSLTRENLAKTQAKLDSPALRAVDLPEDDELEDQSQFLEYLQQTVKSSRPIQPTPQRHPDPDGSDLRTASPVANPKETVETSKRVQEMMERIIGRSAEFPQDDWSDDGSEESLEVWEPDTAHGIRMSFREERLSSDKFEEESRSASAHSDELDLTVATPDSRWLSPVKSMSETARDQSRHVDNIANSLPPSSATMERSPTIRSKVLNTQAILALETQPLDLEVPLDDFDSENESREETTPTPMIAGSMPTAPASNQNAQPKLAETQTMEYEDVDAYITAQMEHGYSENDIVDALKMTSMRPELAELALIERKRGRPWPTDIPGIWCTADDDQIRSGDARAIKAISEKCGSDEVLARIQFLDSYDDIDINDSET